MDFDLEFGLVSEKTKKDSYTIDIRIYVWHNNLGTFNSWVEPNFRIEGRRENEQEGFINLFSSNHYLAFNIIAF